MAVDPDKPFNREEMYLAKAAGEGTTVPDEPWSRKEAYLDKIAGRIDDVEEDVEELKNNPDVVDVVSTYADLQSYDKTSLTDKDVIRVLNDETHDGESSYYRYSSSSDSFAYIGGVSNSAITIYYVDADAFSSQSHHFNIFKDAEFAQRATYTEVRDAYKNAGVQLVFVDSGHIGEEEPYIYEESVKCNVIGAYFDGDPATNCFEILSKQLFPYGEWQGYWRYNIYCYNYNAGAGAGDEFSYSCANLENSGPTVVQATGTSTTSVMSQNAVTSMVYADPSGLYKVRIGTGASVGSTGENIAIGSSAESSGYRSIAMGLRSKGSGRYSVSIGQETTTQQRATQEGSIAIGAGSSSTAKGAIALGVNTSVSTQGVMNIGPSTTSYGYSSSNYRLLTGLYDPQSAHDAATKGYVDTHLGGLTFVALTQTEYDNLGTKDPNTLYIIKAA